MGKHKKFLKSEKAKVKLKGNKLKGPQNVTKTDFKVRKIVISDQLRNVQEVKGERKTHSVQDCLTRLRNSTSVEALSNLRDIVLHQEEDVQKNLEVIVKTVANLSLSIEPNDRRECYRLLNILCGNKNRLGLESFFPVLFTYLKCAMTHIKSGVKESSLTMLSILVKYFPHRIEREKDEILIPFLDMMSNTRNETRSTTLCNSSNKIVSVKLRLSILDHLVALLKCFNKDKRTFEFEMLSKSSSKEMAIQEG